MADLIEIFPDGTKIERAFTAEEKKQKLADIEADELKKQLEAQAAEKRQSALAKLEALGLDIEDLKVLGLG
jgi:hypothetical protein